MATRFQQLGAFVATAANLSDDHLDRFAAVGGRWLVPVIYGDQASGPDNLARIPNLKRKCAARGIALGGWFNYFGENPGSFAEGVAGITKTHNLGPVILDCEAAVQGSTLMARVSLEVRRRITTRSIGVSTNSLNDSVVYNGRIEGVARLNWKSFRDLNIRVLPQWYNSPPYGQRSNPWTTPDLNMAWLKDHGYEDNLYDANAPAPGRAVPLSYVHGTLEVTGLEGADLAGELHDLRTARTFGHGYGFSVYLLENMPYADFDLLAAERGRLFLT